MDPLWSVVFAVLFMVAVGLLSSSEAAMAEDEAQGQVDSRGS